MFYIVNVVKQQKMLAKENMDHVLQLAAEEQKQGRIQRM